jgi:hypothetical protein
LNDFSQVVSTTTTTSNNTTSPSLAFDTNSNTAWKTGNVYNATTGVYSGSNFTIVDGSNVSGEWLEIQTPQTLILRNYTIVAEANSNTVPNTFTLSASSNGTNYTRIHTLSNINDWSAVANWSKTFSQSNLPTSSSYNRFRLITHTIGNAGTNSGREYANIAEWRLNGYSNIVGGGEIGYWFNFPQVAMTSTTQTVSGQVAGNGTYSISTSSLNAISLFDLATTTTSSPMVYDSTTGNYLGSNTTLVGNSNMSGEWIQVNFPYPITVGQILFDTNSTLGTTDSPNTFTLVGANPNGTFSNVLSYSNIGDWGAGGIWYKAYFPNPTTEFFQNWRLIVHRVGNSNVGTGRTKLSLMGFLLRGYNSNLSYNFPPNAMSGTSTSFSNSLIGNGTYIASSSSNLSTFTNSTFPSRLGQSNLNSEVITTDKTMFSRPITLQLTSPTGTDLSGIGDWSAQISVSEMK